MMTSAEWLLMTIMSILSMSFALILGSFVGMATEPWGTMVWVMALGGGGVALHCILAAITGNITDDGEVTR